MDAVREKVAEGMAALPPEQRQHGVQVVKRLLSLDVATPASGDGTDGLEGEAFKHELFEMVYHFWHDTTTQSANVVVFEDLHWADPASVELLLHILPLIEESPVLFLYAFRPYREAPAWQVKLRAEADYPDRYTEVRLQPLSDENSVTLVDNLLQVSDLPPDLKQLILHKAEGNPFFIEEVVRTLIDSGMVSRDESGARWEAAAEVGDITIPDSLYALLVSRMDRLDSDVRPTLQLASVIGRTFSVAVLEKIGAANGHLDQHLNMLQQAELIRQTSGIPEVEYVFQHDLTRDASYKSILRRQRRDFHGKVGEPR